jgi:hypothetical protein
VVTATNLKGLESPPSNPVDVAIPETASLAFAEFGRVTVSGDWAEIGLSLDYAEPVVFAGPLSLNDPQPGFVRISSISQDSFILHAEEWDQPYINHGFEQIAYIALESGRFELPSGLEVEARNVEISNNPRGFRAFYFTAPFSSVPVVLAVVTSRNEGSPAILRIRRVDRSGFVAILQEKEADNQWHTTESVSYVAWEPGSGDLLDTQFEVRSGVWVDSAPKAVSFAPGVGATPCLLADLQTMREADPANVRYDPGSGGGLFQAAEEQSADSEVTHRAEIMGYVAIECPPSNSTKSILFLGE